MCGICGSCSPVAGARLSETVVREMASSISHRGPDGEGFYVDEHAVLGHRRLSIIDLSTGDQPMFNESGTVALIFNGEIYNYKEIRADLLKSGCRLRTESDTEVLIHLYEQKGIDMVDDLNGMFGFAIWDSNKKQLFAARDRLGERPFYYQMKSDGTLNFSSELKALLVGAPTRPALSVPALHDYLTYGYVPAPRTIYEGIFKLPAAHRLVWRAGEVSIDQYWSPLGATVDPSITEEDAMESLSSLLRESVRIRLRSDVPVGAFLSGGVDSSLIVGLASEIRDKPLQTFVVGFDEQRFDESVHAAEVAKIFGTNHHEILVKDLSLDVLPQLVRQFDEPFADPSSLPTYYVTRGAGDALKVCLSGDGADELFGGYTRYFARPLESALRRIPSMVRKPVFGGVAALMPSSMPGAGLMSRLSRNGAEHYLEKIGLFTASEKRSLLNASSQGAQQLHSDLLSPYFDRFDDQLARLRADQETYLPEDILVKVDRNAMYHSLEVRVPFLDHRVVDFANQLPMSFKTGPDAGKIILKNLLKSKLPASLVDRPKHGFSVPISDWFRNEYKDRLKEQLLAPGARISDYLDGNFVTGLYKTHQSGMRDRSHQLWALLWLENWLQEFSSG